MPIDVKIIEQWQGQIWTCHGLLTGRELIAHNDDLLHSRKYDGLRWLLIDLSDTKLEASVEEIRCIGRQEDLLAPAVPDLITAVVVPYDYGFGTARMWEMLTERPGWSRLVSRTRTEADDWLRSEMARKFGILLPEDLTIPLNTKSNA